MNSFYTARELKRLGLKRYGDNVKISKKASIYMADKISIGNNIRVDDFCILSGKISLGNNIHISAYSALYAGEYGIELADFATISSRCCIYAMTDDYTGEYMTNPTVPMKYTNVIGKKVIINKHAIMGSGSLILPGGILAEGVAVGAISMINFETKSWGVYVGIPAKRLRDRKREIERLELRFKSE